MPALHGEGELKVRWLGFVRRLRTLLTGLPEHRHQDQFLRVKEAALALAEGPKMAEAIETAYRGAVLTTNNTPADAADAVEVAVMELEAFPLAVDVHEAEEKAGTAKPGAAKKLRGVAKTILGSIEDLFKLSDYGKGVICVLKEGIDLFD